MPFDGRLVSQLTKADIDELLVKEVDEDESIDYKSQPYGGEKPDDKNRFELCCDVAAFANTGLGYIIIGIEEKDRKPVKLHTIPDPKPYVESIRKTCLDGIHPRPDGLDVGAVQMANNEYVIIIRIPESKNRPYMVKLNHSTHFCQRYNDDKRELLYSDIKDAFVNDTHGLRLHQIDTKLDEIVNMLQQGTAIPSPLSVSDNANTNRDVNKIQQIMELRLREIANQ